MHSNNTSETRFFRDESIFDALALQIIPEWMQRNGMQTAGLLGGRLTLMQSAGVTTIDDSGTGLAGRRLSIWCAACATGQEPYSIAMLLQEKLPVIARLTDIYATDSSEAAVAQAGQGVYSSSEVAQGLPELYLKKYFDRVDDNGYRITADIRGRVRFGIHNLISDAFPCPYDIIFCRNVAIHFTEAQKKNLYEKLQGALRQDGVLVLGAAESLSGYLGSFIIREYGLGRYYELNASQVFMF